MDNLVYNPVYFLTDLYSGPYVIFITSFFMKNVTNQKLVSIKTPILHISKTPIHHTSKTPTCYICKSAIDDLTYRFLIVKDKFHKHKLLPFHYFSPCWDVNYICQNLGEYKIHKAGFSCDQSIKKNPKAINNLRKNYDLWDI